MSYSAKARDHFLNPRNVGTLDDATAVGSAGALGEGNFLVLHLRIDGGRISEVRYQTYGCGASIAAGSMLTEMVKGRQIGECLAITAEHLLHELGGLPLGKEHCAHLAISALRNALRDHGAE